ncbi:DUF2500 domain-containing protein [Paenibacillus spongiae]|uniref:DUF2500 domain-containing protein n=1 Tax=Paenibacillus spongiae TaxID=2909671 RepID=A0ABY5SDZ0_9BACL|nr:DUF2500 domain-containing protein [Paenibacillus spongiae]UVI30493.1 DUF2500 domain-containing protein [Paenibacillus spongiae]
MFTEPSFGGFGILFSIVPVFIVIVFAIVIIGIVTNGARYFKNARSPRESVFARVVAKRMEVRNHTSHHSNGSGGMNPVNSSRTYYYITLEFDNGARKEYLDVKNLFGLVVEGDEGYAAVQGDWIVAFERGAVY